MSTIGIAPIVDWHYEYWYQSSCWANTKYYPTSIGLGNIRVSHRKCWSSCSHHFHLVPLRRPSQQNSRHWFGALGWGQHASHIFESWCAAYHRRALNTWLQRDMYTFGKILGFLHSFAPICSCRCWLWLVLTTVAIGFSLLWPLNCLHGFSCLSVEHLHLYDLRM